MECQVLWTVEQVSYQTGQGTHPCPHIGARVQPPLQQGDCFVAPPLAGLLAMTDIISCLCEPKAKQSHLPAAMLLTETSPIRAPV
jgi:hypothetical protein